MDSGKAGCPSPRFNVIELASREVSSLYELFLCHVLLLSEFFDCLSNFSVFHTESMTFQTRWILENRHLTMNLLH